MPNALITKIEQFVAVYLLSKTTYTAYLEAGDTTTEGGVTPPLFPAGHKPGAWVAYSASEAGFITVRNQNSPDARMDATELLGWEEKGEHVNNMSYETYLNVLVDKTGVGRIETEDGYYIEIEVDVGTANEATYMLPNPRVLTNPLNVLTWDRITYTIGAVETESTRTQPDLITLNALHPYYLSSTPEIVFPSGTGDSGIIGTAVGTFISGGSIADIKNFESISARIGVWTPHTDLIAGLVKKDTPIFVSDNLSTIPQERFMRPAIRYTKSAGSGPALTHMYRVPPTCTYGPVVETSITVDGVDYSVARDNNDKMYYPHVRTYIDLAAEGLSGVRRVGYDKIDIVVMVNEFSQWRNNAGPVPEMYANTVYVETATPITMTETEITMELNKHTFLYYGQLATGGVVVDIPVSFTGNKGDSVLNIEEAPTVVIPEKAPIYVYSHKLNRWVVSKNSPVLPTDVLSATISPLFQSTEDAGWYRLHISLSAIAQHLAEQFTDTDWSEIDYRGAGGVIEKTPDELVDVTVARTLPVRIPIHINIGYSYGVGTPIPGSLETDIVLYANLLGPSGEGTGVVLFSMVPEDGWEFDPGNPERLLAGARLAVNTILLGDDIHEEDYSDSYGYSRDIVELNGITTGKFKLAEWNTYPATGEGFGELVGTRLEEIYTLEETMSVPVSIEMQTIGGIIYSDFLSPQGEKFPHSVEAMLTYLSTPILEVTSPYETRYAVNIDSMVSKKSAVKYEIKTP